VDPEMDRLIQKVIREEFKSCTVLCIAHRLQTVLGYDRMWALLHLDRLALMMGLNNDRFVLDSGRIIENDSPMNLFDKSNGVFRTMCEDSGIIRSQLLAVIGRREAESEMIP
jgi:ATP-binding cassette, subfamily C (CFTR/MRP), member 1